MNFKLIALLASTLTISTNINAAIISTDWQNPGDNLITQDTDSGLEWLDLTVTAGMTYNNVSSQLGVGGDYESWRYATGVELQNFWNAFGGVYNYYIGWTTQNNGLYDLIAPYVGDTFCDTNGCATGDGGLTWILADLSGTFTHFLASSGDWYTSPDYQTKDYFKIHHSTINNGISYYDAGSALVREISSVPVPAALWLFGSGFIGLIRTARRKTHS